MSKDVKNLIIVKRPKKGGHGHHGGAWKIAYADFVTAMMAFFLLMWLLGSTSKGEKEIIAEYFRTPLMTKLSSGGTGKGPMSQQLNGGANSMSRTMGQNKVGDRRYSENKSDYETAEKEVSKQDRQVLEQLKATIEQSMESDQTLRQFKNQIKLEITDEGLLIQIVDEKNRPMFDTGSAELKPYTIDLLKVIAKLLSEIPNKISIGGHTDAAPYVGKGITYTNWELSSERANACRRELIIGGLDEKKLIRVSAHGSTKLLVPDDPLNPSNRRIAIIVLNKRSENRIIQGS